MSDGQPLWRYVLQLIVDRWNAARNLIPVLAATADLDMASTRRIIPEEMPVLLAGIGAQGGDLNCLRGLLNKDKSGAFVNSSRGLLYPANTDGLAWQQAILEAVVQFKQSLNDIRRNGAHSSSSATLSP
jgi:orotidine-5'-phosphate decarboxylase